MRRIVAGIVLLGVSASVAGAQPRNAGVQHGTPPGVVRVVGCYDSSLMVVPHVARILPRWVRIDRAHTRSWHRILVWRGRGLGATLVGWPGSGRNSSPFARRGRGTSRNGGGPRGRAANASQCTMA